MPYKDPASKKANRRWRMERNVEIVREAKSGPCVDCAIRLPWRCMDLDHVRGEFKFWIGSGWLDMSADRVLAEIAKCVLRCPNCHRLRHFQEDGRWGAPSS